MLFPDKMTELLNTLAMESSSIGAFR